MYEDSRIRKDTKCQMLETRAYVIIENSINFKTLTRLRCKSTEKHKLNRSPLLGRDYLKGGMS